MTYPLVSVLITVYNHEFFLKAALNSVLAQTYPNIEIVIVDDGSTDGSLAVAQSYASENVRVFSIPNGGQCAAFNYGLKQIKGEYVQFLDSDDLLHPEKISAQMKVLMDAGEDCIAVGKWASMVDSIETASFAPQACYISDAGIPWIQNLLGSSSMMANCGYLSAISVVKKAGPYAEQITINKDTEYFTRIALNAKKVLFCPDSICYYRMVEGSASRSRTHKSLSNMLDAQLLCVNHLLAAANDEASRKAAAAMISRFLYHYGFHDDFYKICKDKLKQIGVAKPPLPMKGNLGLFGKLASILGTNTAFYLWAKYKKYRQ